MGRAEKILSLFPCVYGAREETKLINKIVRRLAQPIEEVDAHLFRIQRAHRLEVAEHAVDLERLAEVLNILPAYFDDLAQAELPYEERLERMRTRIQRIALIHLDGLGTPRAVILAAAVLIDGTVVPAGPDGREIVHMDAGGFSHRATVRLADAADGTRDRIVLHENPLRRKKVPATERWPLDDWILQNESVEPSPLRIVIQGQDERTVMPSIFCPDTDGGFLFNGLVPGGSTLIIDERGRATLDGRSVDDWLVRFQGAVSDFDDSDRGAVSVDEGHEDRPFDGDLASLVSRPFVLRKTPLDAPVGPSTWIFKVAEGVYDGAPWDYAVFATEHEDIGGFDDTTWDNCVYDFAPHGKVGLGWGERIPCAFKLIVPRYRAAMDGSAEPDAAVPAGSEADAESSEGRRASPSLYADRVARFMPRFKAAAIRAYVAYARDAWILGQSTLRNDDAVEGAGIEWKRATLRREAADRTVPLDS